MNTAGTELPIHNYQKFLDTIKRANGDEVLKSFAYPQNNPRLTNVHRLVPVSRKEFKVLPTKSRKSKPPHNITVFKGTKNVLISRNFSDFIVSHPVAVDYYEWIKDIKVNIN